MKLSPTMLSLQGKRAYQEDRYFAGLIGDIYVAAVIDGHGGSDTAQLCQELIPLKFGVFTFTGLFEHLHYNSLMRYHDGACLLIASINSKVNLVSIAHVGDCVAFLRTKKNIKRLTEIHQLSNPEEARRFRNRPTHGKYVLNQHCSGLMPTRTIGDANFTDCGILHVPQLSSSVLEPGDSLILCTDGVTDSLSDENIKGNARQIVKAAYAAGSSDNITAIVIDVVL